MSLNCHAIFRSARKITARTSPESDDEELRPTFRSGQHLVRPGGVGYGDNHVPADDDVPPQRRMSPHQPPALSSEDTSTDVQDTSTDVQDPRDPPGLPEVPVEDNYNTFIRDDLASNPPPTRAPNPPTGHDTYDHIVLNDQRAALPNPSYTYNRVDVRPMAYDDYRHDLTSDVYRRVDISTKTNRNGDDDTNGGYSSQII